MPFDFDSYKTKCDGLTTEQLHREWENYTRQVSGGATATATSVLFSPLTAGISLVGLGLSAPRVHNARKKREIIEAGLNSRGETTHTRKRDVVAPMAISGFIGGVTLGLAGPGADLIAGEVVGKGAEYAAAHVVLDATGAVAEHKHDSHSKKKADQKLSTQYQNFQKQYIQEQALLQATQAAQAPQATQVPQQHGQQLPVHQNSLQTSGPGQQLLPQPDVQVQVQQGGEVHQSQPYQYQYQPAPPSQSQKYEYVPALAPSINTGLYQPAPPSQDQKYEYVNVPQTDVNQQPPPYSPPAQEPAPLGSVSTLVGQEYPISANKQPSFPPTPASLAPTASVSMEDEIALLKARILQMEIEKRGGIIQVEASLSTESKQPDVELTSRTGSMFEPAPLAFYPPPPASPAPPLASISPVPIQQNPSVYQDAGSPYNAAPLAEKPAIYQYTSHLDTSTSHVVQQTLPPPPSSPHPQVASRHQSLAPSYQPPYSAQQQHRLSLPASRPQSQVFSQDQYPPLPNPSTPISQPMQHYPPPPPSPQPSQQVQNPLPSAQIVYNPSVHPTSIAIPSAYQQQPYVPAQMENQQNIQRQDSGYYSIPPSRHESSCSYSSQQGLTPQSTSSSAMLSPQSTGSVYQAQHHGRSASVSSMVFASPSPMPMTPQPAPQQQQMYFPPPPGAAGKGPAAASSQPQGDYFSQNYSIGTSAPAPMLPVQSYNPAQHGQTQPPGNYGRPAAATQNYATGTQGWQWGMPAPAAGKSEPDYGAPPPIPQPWKG